ncbi:SCO2522 family protein [Streptomyces sp. NBC_01352]|uniref:SCO2522 family protein n=1 Tax=Streptomyces plumbiresistens TaxID=511811 RepID=A0ABP7T2Y3_9ACTN|nr:MULTISPECIES: SCO2522 family protein [unclassified Streptomyces]MCX4702814.1 SCO2522 family protein [Streptomyces sp. NBC_01373]
MNAAEGESAGVREAAFVYRESSDDHRTRAVAYSHLSVELGHLYMEDFAAGPERLRAHFAQVAPWAATARSLAGPKRRVSTCFLVDDYFTQFSSPAEAIPMVTRAASKAGLRIDYLARESACAATDSVRTAELLLARLVKEPPVGGNGARPPVEESGWFCNGVRSRSDVPAQAMSTATAWEPPLELGARRHSVFLDAQLWSTGRDGRRLWSCPFLAAVWQMLRLGLLRDRGEVVLPPQSWDEDDFPEEWHRLPPVLRLNPQAPPFCGYRTFSVLDSRFLPVEHAVRMILDHTAADPAAMRQVAERSVAEGLAVPPALAERVLYAFTTTGTQGGGT